MRFLILCFLILLATPSFAIINIEDERVSEGETGLQLQLNFSFDSHSGNLNKEIYSFESKISYITENRHETLLLTDRNVAVVADVNTEDDSFYHLRYALPLSEDFYWETFIQSEVDHYYHLTYRKLAGAGLRYRMGFEKKVYSHYIGLGGFYEKESYQDIGIVQENRVNLYWRYKRVIMLEKESSIIIGQILYYQPSLKTKGNERGTWEPYLKFKLTKNLKLKFSYLIKYDSQPVFKTYKTDRFFTQSFQYKF